ncbi:hypothetical protein FRC03_005227, partial [Tulasnella sp. 419]
MKLSTVFGALCSLLPLAVEAVTTWKSVHVGGGGGFVPGIVFSEAQQGVAFARTDIGGLYRLNSDDSWTPLTDWVDNDHWNYWGVDALALDPTDAKKLYIAVGMYTNSWDPNNGSILKSSDSGNTWTDFCLLDDTELKLMTGTAVAGQTNTYIPHRGVISPSEKTLYITYGNGAGPYDGTLGSVWKYKIDTGVWTDITPQKSDLYFGFGGLGVDLKKPGTIMVATVNSWWPDGQIFRSNDSGATWSPLWAWNPYPTLERYYTYDTSLAPWISVKATDDTKEVGWMMESLSIDPFDSDHWLYGTGLTIYGGHDLTKWDTTHKITLKSLADGIEEFAVQALVSPPTGPNLLSAIYDVGGFAHTSLTTAPTTMFVNP